MLDLGIVRPGRAVRIPFATFDKDDSSSITMTNFLAADVLIYKNGGTTPRSGTSGITATTDFASKTGRHLLVIDLADNNDAGFFSVGSEYLVMIDSVTVDTVTVGNWAARFWIGYVDAIWATTVASVTSQSATSIVVTLSVGSADDDAYNDCEVWFNDVASNVQIGRGVVTDYVGSTKTLTITLYNTIFTVAATDGVSIFRTNPVTPLVSGRRIDVDTAGLVTANTTKIGGTTQTAGDIVGILGALNVAASSGDVGTTTTVTAYLKQLINTLEGTPGLPTFPAAAVAANAVSLAEVIRSIDSRLPAALGANSNLKVDVRDYNGTPGTFASGRPEVNTTHAAGTAVQASGGYFLTHDILNVTTIATLASQTSFTLTAGSADNNAYLGCEVFVLDASTAVQKAVGVCSAYTGSTRTVTLRTDPGVFTMAVGDIVAVKASRALQPTVDTRTADVTTTGEVGIDWGNIGNQTTTVNLSGTTVKTATDVETDTQDIQLRLPAALTGGGNIKADTLAISGDTVAADNLESATDGTGYNIGNGSVVCTSVTGNVGGSVGSVSGSIGALANGAKDDVSGIIFTRLLSHADFSTVGSFGKLVKDNLNTTIDSRMATYVQPTGFLSTTFPSTVSSSSEVTAIQNNTRTVIVVPDVIERPDSGTTTYRVEMFLYDETGNMESPDSAPTITLVNQSGTDRSSRLDSTTMTLVSTGRYRSVYTADVGDALEQLVWAFSVVEGGSTRLFGRGSLVVDTTAVDFTAADRTKLDTLSADYTTARAVKLDNLDGTITSRQATIWSSVGATVNLSGTTVKTATDVETDTADIQSRLPAALTGDGNIKSDSLKLNGATPNNISTVQVNAEVDTALADYDAPTNAEMVARTLLTADYATATNLATVATYVDTEITTIITHLTDIKGATFDGTTDSLEAIRNRGDTAWTTATGFSSHTPDDVWAVAERTVTGGTVDVLITLPAIPNNWLTTAGIADGAITDAKITVPNEGAGNPTGILGMLRRVFEWRKNKKTRNRTTGVVTLRNAADDGNLVTYTQSTASTTDTEDASS